MLQHVYPIYPSLSIFMWKKICACNFSPVQHSEQHFSYEGFEAYFPKFPSEIPLKVKEEYVFFPPYLITVYFAQHFPEHKQVSTTAPKDYNTFMHNRGLTWTNLTLMLLSTKQLNCRLRICCYWGRAGHYSFMPHAQIINRALEIAYLLRAQETKSLLKSNSTKGTMLCLAEHFSGVGGERRKWNIAGGWVMRCSFQWSAGVGRRAEARSPTVTPSTKRHPSIAGEQENWSAAHSEEPLSLASSYQMTESEEEMRRGWERKGEGRLLAAQIRWWGRRNSKGKSSPSTDWDGWFCSL